MNVYPGNVCNQYRIRLDNSINLIDKPNWEVGLVEMSYVHSLRTIEKGESIFVMENSETMLSTITLQKSLLNNITKEKNTTILNQTNLDIEVKDEKVHIHMYLPSTTLYLPNLIARHFGFLPPPGSKHDEYKDEHMHILTNKTSGKWTAVAPYFLSKQPVHLISS